MTAGRTIAAAARAAARNKVVQGLAASAGAAAAKHAGPIAQQRYAAWRDRRVDRDRAIKLARQLRGRYSQDTIIDGVPHFVVWKDGAPIAAFPHVDQLETRPELQGFDTRLTREPPPQRRLRPNGQE
ncbi:MAG TPA: hypothetical protein VKA45_07495 [Gaiellaceae bacterium]|nr:hypothetical protein [Gaiellaceae bacterium]